MFGRNFKALTYVFLLILVSGFSVAALAQKFIENYAPKMPDIALKPAAEFDASTTLYEDTPGGDQALSYRFRLPKEWGKSDEVALTNYTLSNKILGELVRFYGPPMLDKRSYFSIQAIKLEYKLSAEEWLLQHLLSNGYTIQGMTTHDENRAEALFVKIDQGETYIIRAVAQINGKRVVLAQYFMPSETWEEEKVQQAQVMQTFKLTHPVQELVEDMNIYHFLDIAEFQYPKSWEFRAPPLRNPDRMNFQLLNVASEKVVQRKKFKTLDGRIQVDIVSYSITESLESEIAKLKEDISKIGLVIGDKFETRKDFKFNEDVTAVPVEIYQAVDTEDNLLNYEYWVTSIEHGDYYYLITLVTPSRDEDFYIWSRNSQTYKLIVELFHPLDEGLIYR